MSRVIRYGVLITALLALVSGLAYGGLKWQVQANCDRFRADGLTALEEDRFHEAVEWLGRRVTQESCGDPDAETLFAFGKARARIPTPGASHTVESIAALKKAALLWPDNHDIWINLSQAWLGIGEAERAIGTARNAIAAAPEDRIAQRLLLTGLLAGGRNLEVREIVDEALIANPDRWWLHIARLSALDASPVPQEITTTDLAALSPAQQDVVLAFSALLSGDEDEAKRRLTSGGSAGIQENLLFETRIDLMDGADLIPEALALLHQNRRSLNERLRTRYVELAWQTGQTAWVSDFLSDERPRIRIEPNLVLLSVLSNQARGSDSGRSTQILEDQAIYSDADRRWHELIERILESRPDAAIVNAAQRVLEIDGRNPYVMQVLAEAWLDLGEPIRAANLARRSMQLARHWPLPAQTLTGALLRIGQPEAALEAAIEATRRGPQDPRSGLALARTWGQMLDTPGGVDADTLTGLLDTLGSIPGIEPAALDAIRSLTVATPVRSDAARVSIELVDPAATTVSLSTPASASEPVDATATTPSDRTAKTINRLSAPEAERCAALSSGTARSACWSNLLQSYPGDLNAHLLTLAAATSDQDRKLELQAIEGIDALTPANSAVGRIANARRLLTTNPDQKSAAEAALLLRGVLKEVPQQADAHLLMALALAHLRDLPAVGAHLIETVAVQPRRAEEALRLSLHIAEDVIDIPSNVLIGWWESITWLEYEFRISGPRGERRFTEQAFGVDERKGGETLAQRLGVLAAFAEIRSDGPLAEAVYRRMIALDSSAHVAMNNLAMLLIGNEDELTEALALIETAIGLAPANADYKDTLVQVRSAIDLAEKARG